MGRPIRATAHNPTGNHNPIGNRAIPMGIAVTSPTGANVTAVLGGTSSIRPFGSVFHNGTQRALATVHTGASAYW